MPKSRLSCRHVHSPPWLSVDVALGQSRGGEQRKMRTGERCKEEIESRGEDTLIAGRHFITSSTSSDASAASAIK
eukprot:758323-Hanusia_phi.AAC.3